MRLQSGVLLAASSVLAVLAQADASPVDKGMFRVRMMRQQGTTEVVDTAATPSLAAISPANATTTPLLPTTPPTNATTTPLIATTSSVNAMTSPVNATTPFLALSVFAEAKSSLAAKAGVAPTNTSEVAKPSADGVTSNLTDGAHLSSPTTSAAASGCKGYTIVQNDIGDGIAKEHGITLNELQEHNPGVNLEILQPSQTLILPPYATGADLHAAASCGITLVGPAPSSSTPSTNSTTPLPPETQATTTSVPPCGTL
ncbi:uncharacterized protein HMPREF1541_10295 [Cyphellophora europaea CBS 101466]|uniref:LysM domain-containing protein n=1 Tax=Cyphellophora europaea (strain CBS 101466) TaxID=1220924 RepID=W2S7L3_CYPE1|nr:uncharacterized protein HMPREF1541_10295 [Cyphellophora europaea CBS 101466]ETN44625.1 hypothetical protein HMPREF1541_10295 [Cyphellophora europaea CBS 101466]